jgi:hypothetical protein
MEVGQGPIGGCSAIGKKKVNEEVVAEVLKITKIR